jgi:metal-responsive CopG/Arc/MetJ family transcriptional regulator
MSKQDTKDDTVGISVRVPKVVVEEIDRIADVERRTRGNVIRILLEDALAARKKGGAK